MRSVIKHLGKVSLMIFSVTLTCTVIRTILVQPPPSPIPCDKQDEDFIPESRGLSQRLAQAIRFKTISTSRHNYDRDELFRFGNYIKETFPRIHSCPFIHHQVVNNLSFLYKVEGKNSKLQPYMLCAHFDVVPVNEELWDDPPFEGTIKDGFLYGRGTIDDKSNVMGILEAVDFMIEKKLRPDRSFYIAFGHDEEVNGIDGAGEIAKILEKNGVQLLYLLDEGPFILKSAVPGVERPVALVGISEKGYLTLKLSVNSTPGHSSMPPIETAIGILSNALSKLKGDSHTNLFGKGPEMHMLESLAPYASIPYRFVFANLWLFSPLLALSFETSQSNRASIRTTTAVTMIGGGLKENVVPNYAWALVNHRIHPVQSAEEVIQFDKVLINDPRVDFEILQLNKPAPFSPYDKTTFGYQIIKSTINQVKPGTPVAPVTLVANTDTMWYLNLTKQVYRFSAYSMDRSELPRLHGHNERISLECYERMVNFYYHLIRNSDSEQVPTLKLNDEL